MPAGRAPGATGPTVPPAARLQAAVPASALPGPGPAAFPLSGPAAAGPLIDPQGRRLDYLRLAVTDNCNLRCRYCLPAAGIALAERDELLSFAELVRLGAVFAGLGVRSIRLTGGEPLVRRDLVDLVAALGSLPGNPEVLLTTNGLLLVDHLDALARAGLRRVNLSLDSLDEGTWTAITRREGFARARAAIDEVLARGLGLKLNMVVLPGWNDHELDAFVELTRERPLTVRFIEPMPFVGEGRFCGPGIAGSQILARLATGPLLVPEPARPGAVEKLFRLPGHAGRVGIIEGHSRTFCGGCRRLRLDARGRLRTCLYGRPSAFLRPLIRAGADDDALAAAVRGAVAARLPDGVAAEADHRRHNLESMINIGG